METKANRKTLKKGSILTLTTSLNIEIKYEIQGLCPNGDFGSSCLCYISKRLSDESNKIVLLKEFYPLIAEGFIIRHDNNSTNISELLSSPNPLQKTIQKKLDSFKKNTYYLKKYSEFDNLSESICNSDFCELMSGNGTFYYENEFIPGVDNWLRYSNRNDIKEDELIQTAIGSIRFLKEMHLFPNSSGNGDALVDFKPQDVLIPLSKEMNIPSFETPLFFDFGGVLEMNKAYLPQSIQETTPQYRPMIFNQNESEIEITRKTENYTFSKVLNEILFKSGREKYLKSEIKEKLMGLIRSTADERLRNDISEDDIENSLLEIRNEIRNEENHYHKNKFPRRKIIYNILLFLLLIFSIIAHALTGLILVELCFYPESARQIMTNYNIGLGTVLILLCGTAILLTLLKMSVFLFSQYIAQMETSTIYFDKTDLNGRRITTGEFNTFRYHFTRKSTTYQDFSDSNRNRQHVRVRNGIIAVIATILSLVISIKLNAFPIFLSAVLIILTIFMHFDYIASMIDRFNRCTDKEHQNKSFREKRARYYFYEYKASLDEKNPKPFKLSANYYQNHYRDIVHIRKILKKEEKKVDLDFNPLIIRNIYKMTFDKIRNYNLILTLSVLIGTIFTILMVIMSFTGIFKEYFMLPTLSYKIFIPTLIILSTGMSIYQIFTAYHTEKMVADVSYKSRYIMNFALNDMLVEDIKLNKVKPIDIIRGVHQYDGIIHSLERNKNNKVTKISNRINTKLLREQKPYNKELLHYDIMPDQRRSDFTVWMFSAAFISIVVWYMGLYYMLLPLLFLTVLVQIFFNKVLVPQISIISVTKDIEKYIK